MTGLRPNRSDSNPLVRSKITQATPLTMMTPKDSVAGRWSVLSA